MIFTESTIKISNNVSKMDSTIVLYRGDKNVEIRFTILQSPFKYSNTVATNIIESTNASYGQLVIKTPNDKPPIFSEVSATKEGTVLFTITKEMIDEIEEVGVYTFQIRLMDENKQSRVTIPPVENGIEIKEPIAIEDDNTTNVVGLAKANYAVATLSDADIPTFDDNGKYNKTNWNDGDIITNVSLNKIEEGIYTTNENVTATKKYVDDGINYDHKQFNNKIVAMNISKHPVSCSTEIYKKPLCDIFPELLNITYNTVFKEFNSFKVNMDNFTKEYPTVKSAYNKLNINLYDENDNSIGNSYGNSINGEGLNIIFINITESLRFYAYFDKALVDGSSTTMETKNGYMTIQLLIPKGNNKQEFIDKIKNLKLTLSVFRTDFLNLNNETMYTPTTDYNPATKKYVDDNTVIHPLPIYKMAEAPTMITYTVNIMDLKKLTTYGAIRDINSTKYQRYHFIYPCDDGTNKTIVNTGDDINDTTFRVYHYDNSSTLTFNNVRYSIDYTKHNTSTDVIVTEYIQNYLGIYNTREYTPTEDYNPATKKYVDDNTPIKSLPVNPTTKTGAVVDVNNITVSGCYALPKRTDGKHWTNLIMRAMINDGSDKGTSIMLSGYQNHVFHVNLETKKIYCDNLRIVYSIGTTADTTYIRTEPYYLPTTNTKEFTPTKEYHPATKKYVDDNKIGYIKSETVGETIDTSPMISSFKNNSYIYESNNVTYLEMGKEYHVIVNGVRYRALCINNMPGNDQIYETIAVNGNGFSISIMNKFGYNTKYYPDNTKCAYEIKLSDELLAAPPTIQILKMDIEYIPTYLMPKDLGILNSISINRIGDIGTGSVAIGYNNTASNDFTFAMGINTTAIATAAHAEGGYTVANASYSHAEGFKSASTGEYSHVEGIVCVSSGQGSHAEGYYTVSSGQRSHSEGCFTEAASQYQHVQGKYNVVDSSGTYAHIVGNGTGKDNRHNAHTLDWQGNGWYAGKVTAGAAPVEDMDLTTKKYVDDKVSSLPQISFNENGELVVTINGVSKTFVPKNV